MNKCSTKSRNKQASAAQPAPNALHRGPIATILSHDDIARRAYEIHVAHGRRQGRSEQDWFQAEEELKSRQDWLQDRPEIENRDWAGAP
jgi:hypothetical protein